MLMNGCVRAILGPCFCAPLCRNPMDREKATCDGVTNLVCIPARWVIKQIFIFSQNFYSFYPRPIQSAATPINNESSSIVKKAQNGLNMHRIIDQFIAKSPAIESSKPLYSWFKLPMRYLFLKATFPSQILIAVRTNKPTSLTIP